MTPPRTYWHLRELGRKPSAYDIGSSRLHYWTAAGFEVDVPVAQWYAEHQAGSPLRCRDWEQFSDPRQTTYATYTALQSAKETFVDGLFDSVEPEYDRRLSAGWLDVLDRVMAPLRYPVHGLQMVAAYVGQMAPSGRITIAAAMQAADEMRRVQRLAYRLRQIQETHPAFGRDARARWQDDPLWQPLREAVERLLVTWDWGEAVVALQLVVKPAFDHLFVTELGLAARASRDDVLERLSFSLGQDCRWHREWGRALVLTALRGAPDNADCIDVWVERWAPRIAAAVAPFAAVLGAGGDGRAEEGQQAIDAASRRARESWASVRAEA